jgi:hypothetical protein
MFKIVKLKSIDPNTVDIWGYNETSHFVHENHQRHFPREAMNLFTVPTKHHAAMP